MAQNVQLAPRPLDFVYEMQARRDEDNTGTAGPESNHKSTAHANQRRVMLHQDIPNMEVQAPRDIIDLNHEDRSIYQTHAGANS